MSDDYFMKSVVENLGSQQRDIASQASKLERLESLINEIKNDFKAIESYIPVIQEASKKAQSFATDVSDIYQAIFAIKKEIQSLSDVSKHDKEHIAGLLKSLLDSFSSHKASCDSAILQINESLSKKQDSGYELSSKLEALQRDTSGIIENFKSEFDKSIKAWVTEQLSIHKAPDLTHKIESIRNEVSKKLEMIMLECHNALLKSGNIADQIPMINKRIENLYLSLQKIEISQKQ